MIKDKIVVFGDNSLAEDIKTHLEKEDENFVKISETINYEDEDVLINIGITKDVHKVFALMNSLETNILLILSIRAIDKDVKIFSKSGNISESEKLKLAGADNILDYNELTSHGLFNLIQKPNVTRVLDKTIFTETGVQIFETFITEFSKYINRDISDIELENSILIGAVVNNGDFIFSKESYIIQKGDTLIFVYE